MDKEKENEKEKPKAPNATLEEMLAFDLSRDVDTNTPLKLLSNRVNIIGCSCTHDMIANKSWCPNCQRISVVNDMLLEVFRDV